MQELAHEVGRLADAIDRYVQLEQCRERTERDERLKAEWPPGTVRPLGLSTFLQAIPGLAARFDKIVPPEFVVSVAEDELEIACPCGQTPRVRAGRLQSCDCNRWFLHDGRSVHVAKTSGTDAGAAGRQPLTGPPPQSVDTGLAEASA